MSDSRKTRFTDREVPIPRSSLERRGFLRGVARLVEFGRVFERRSLTAELPDPMAAIAGDWQRIGGDLRAAVKHAEVELPAETDGADLVKA